MGLSCYCGEYDPEPGDVVYYQPGDYSTYSGHRACRCQSCGARIAPGDTVIAFKRNKVPDTDIECRIYGEDGEIPRANQYFCETCADLYFSLTDLGFCVGLYDQMHDLAKEYAAVYGRGAQHDR